MPWTPHYLQDLGDTFQAYQLTEAPDATAERDTALWLARFAELPAAARMLDAGCGVCGPALHLATAFEALSIDAVTISPCRPRSDARRASEAGLSARVRPTWPTITSCRSRPTPSTRVFFLESGVPLHHSRGALPRGVARAAPRWRAAGQGTSTSSSLRSTPRNRTRCGTSTRYGGPIAGP